MSRVRVSTTVDEGRPSNAGRIRPDTPDAALLDEALDALVAKYRAAEVDASYAVDDEHPLDEADDWVTSPLSVRLPERREPTADVWRGVVVRA